MCQKNAQKTRVANYRFVDVYLARENLRTVYPGNRDVVDSVPEKVISVFCFCFYGVP